MPTIAEQKELRRTRLSLLLKEISAQELSRLSGIAKAYLYQMSDGQGDNKRGVSDDNARKIERAAGKPEHWLDMEEKPKSRHSKVLRPDDPDTVRPMGKPQGALVRATRQLAGSLTDEQANVLTDLLYVMSGLAHGKEK